MIGYYVYSSKSDKIWNERVVGVLNRSNGSSETVDYGNYMNLWRLNNIKLYFFLVENVHF